VEFNRKGGKHMRLNKHVTILKTPQDRDYFTRRGLHLNGQGKEIISSQLATITGELFQLTEVIPIILGWISNQATALELVTSCVGNEFNNIHPKDVMEDGCNAEEPEVGSASNRQKKVPSI
jgi:hypothetical protein